MKKTQHQNSPSLNGIEETYEDLQNNPLTVLALFRKHSNGKETIYLRSSTGGHTIGFCCPKNKKRIKFWVVGGPGAS